MSYREELIRIQQLPRKERYDVLSRCAEPLYVEPPRQEWASIAIDEAAPHDMSDIPFTITEIEAIKQVRAAHKQILEDGAARSGVARQCFMGTGRLLRPSERLLHRPVAVYGIMIVGLCAQDALTSYADTAWQPNESQKAAFTICTELPDKLTIHS